MSEQHAHHGDTNRLPRLDLANVPQHVVQRRNNRLPPSLMTTTTGNLQQQRALGRDDFRAPVEAKTRGFAGVRPTHRPRRSPRKPPQSDAPPTINTNSNGRK